MNRTWVSLKRGQGNQMHQSDPKGGELQLPSISMISRIWKLKLWEEWQKLSSTAEVSRYVHVKWLTLQPSSCWIFLRRRCLNFGKPWIFKSPNLLSDFFLACVAEVIGTASQKGIQRIPPILLQSWAMLMKIEWNKSWIWLPKKFFCL